MDKKLKLLHYKLSKISIQINYMLIYCYFNKKIYINWCFVDVMKIHPTLANLLSSAFSYNINSFLPIERQMWPVYDYLMRQSFSVNLTYFGCRPSVYLVRWKCFSLFKTWGTEISSYLSSSVLWPNITVVVTIIMQAPISSLSSTSSCLEQLIFDEVGTWEIVPVILDKFVIQML